MGWEKFVPAAGNNSLIQFGSQVNEVSILPDGSVLITMVDENVTVTGHPKSVVRMYPDSVGQYGSGATFVQVGPMPYPHWGGHVVVLNDGTVLVSGSHPSQIWAYGAQGEFKADLYNPETNVWGPDPLTNGVSVTDHTPMVLDEDGRLHGLYITTVPGVNNVYRDPIKGIVNYPINELSGVLADSISLEEAGACLLPDGSFIAFRAGSNTLTAPRSDHTRAFPKANSGDNIEAGSYPGKFESFYTVNDGVNGPPITSGGAVTESDWLWRYYYGLPYVSLTSLYGVFNESGSQLWMSKIGRVVACGANGEIFAYDPLTNKLEVRAVFPWDATEPVLWRVGTIHADSAGYLQRNGFISFTNDTVTTLPQDLCDYSVVLNDGSYFMFKTFASSSSEYNYQISGNGQLGQGNKVKVRTFFRAINCGNVAGQLAVGDPVYLNAPPRRVCQETGLVIMPSGDVILSAGIIATGENSSQGGRVSKFYGSDARFYAWNGIDKNPVDISPPRGQANSLNPYDSVDPDNISLDSPFWYRLTVLPTGQLAVFSGGGTLSPQNFSYWIWTPEAPWNVVDETARPVIDSFPITVASGKTYILKGTQLTGTTSGRTWNDDWVGWSNIPIVRFDSKFSNLKKYGYTKNFTYRGIARNRKSQCSVTIPDTLPNGEYFMYVICNGVSSIPLSVTVSGASFSGWNPNIGGGVGGTIL